MRLPLLALVIASAHITAAVDSTPAKVDGAKTQDEGVVVQLFRALEGPAFRSGKDLGSSYMTPKYSSWTIDEKVASIIKHTCVKNAFVGATTSLAPFVGVAGGIAGSMYLQVVLTSAVATVHGMDPEDERIQLIIYAVLGGDVATEALKASLKAAGIKTAKQFFKQGSGKVVKVILDKTIKNTAVSVAKVFGKKTGVAAIFGAVPVVGSVISFGVDGGMCYAIANAYNFAAFQVDWFV